MNELDFSVTQQPDAIEQYFCKKFDTLPKREMDDDQMAIFIMVQSLNGDADKLKHMAEAFRGQFKVLEMVEKRAKLIYHLNLSIDAAIILSSEALNMGTAVMYLTQLRYHATRRGFHSQDLITLKDFISMFPEGFPTKESSSELWRSVKVNGDRITNLLDHASAMISIMPEDIKIALTQQK